MRSNSFAIATLLSAACAVNAATVKVDVGLNGKLTFSPNPISANVNDVIQFNFHGAHSATQSSSSSSCDSSGGFDSKTLGINGVYNHSATEAGTFYLFCKVGDHCKKDNMRATLIVGSGAAATNETKSSGTPTNSPSSASTTATGGTSNPTTTSSSTTGGGASGNSTDGAMQVGGGAFLGAAMALLVGLAL